jgi:hypothetical protein
MKNEPSGALSKILLKAADIPEFNEDLPDVLQLAKESNLEQREQFKPSVLDQYQYEVQRSYDDDADHGVLQPNIKVASLKEQSLFLR